MRKNNIFNIYMTFIETKKKKIKQKKQSVKNKRHDTCNSDLEKILQIPSLLGYLEIIQEKIEKKEEIFDHDKQFITYAKKFVGIDGSEMSSNELIKEFCQLGPYLEQLEKQIESADNNCSLKRLYLQKQVLHYVLGLEIELRYGKILERKKGVVN